MAELPELEILRVQMNSQLTDGTVAEAEALQEKCLNVPASVMVDTLTGKRVTGVSRRGKWLVIAFDDGHRLLICPGMGFDLWHYGPGDSLPSKYQLRLGFDDGTGFTCRFWWFGYVRLLSEDEVDVHPEIAKLGPCPMGISDSDFAALVRKYPRSTVKSLILDQEKLAGIGNAYSHDILWTARLHPNRKLGTLDEGEIHAYLQAIREILDRAIRLGGIEDDFFRKGGNHSNWEAFSMVGYKEGKPCPRCGSSIEKVKSGATSSFICPTCQQL